MGIVMLDVPGYELTSEDKEILEHPLTGGVIFFSRNYHDPRQITELSRQVKKAAKKPVLIAVDQEGGRVQRFRDGFSSLPAMGDIIQYHNNDMAAARETCSALGELMATEIQAVGIDISFAPVADINHISDVIGDRGFSTDKQQVVELVTGFCLGMRSAGMATTGKHFPGHGSVKEDSHFALPIDKREVAEIIDNDYWVFQRLSEANLLDAVMPAHVVYPNIDDKPAGFSSIWLQRYLRDALKFDGVIFSDDLAMAGAVNTGSPTERAEAAMQAGCDMVLMCNDRAGAIHILDGYQGSTDVSPRVVRMIQNRPKYPSLAAFYESERFLELSAFLRAFDER